MLTKRQEMSLKNTLFNRYLLFRYTLALFFFGDLYWLLIQLTTKNWLHFFPSTLLLLIICACIEQFKLYGKKEAQLNMTSIALCFQGFIQLVLLIASLTPLFEQLFPIFALTLLARLIVFSILGLGFILILFTIRRMKQINNNSDRAYYLYLQMKHTVSQYKEN